MVTPQSFENTSEAEASRSRKVASEDTELRQARLRIQQLEERLRQQQFQAKYRGVELEALYDVGLAIASTLDLGRLSEEILLRAVSLLDARRGAFYALENGSYHLRSTIGCSAVELVGEDQEEALAWLRAGALGEQPLAVTPLMPGSRDLLAAVVESENQSLGLLVLGDKESRSGVGPFPDKDRRTLALFAQQAAIALENAHLHRQALEKERMERDMELASQIQQQILPKCLPRLAGYELFGWNQPARQVGGDYYDVVRRPDGRLVLVVADVSGKGMPAALMVSTLYSALRMGLDQHALGPELMARLNRHILELSLPNKFITLLIAELEPETGDLCYLNAGHNPGLLVHPGGEVERLPAGGLPLGLMPDAQYEVSSTRCQVGGTLCLYSDGITECVSPEDEEFGEGRLVDILRRPELLKKPAMLNHHEPKQGPKQGVQVGGLPALFGVIEAECRAFARGQAQGDDQTVVLLHRSC